LNKSTRSRKKQRLLQKVLETDSARSLGKSIRDETERVGDSVKGVVNNGDVEGKAKAAADQVKVSARSAGRKAMQFNDKYHLTESVAKAAVCIGAVYIASGNVRAGASTLAVGGAAMD
jgi:hypothetical protein